MSICPRLFSLLACASALVTLTAEAQTSRITQPINNRVSVVLHGHISPRAQRAVDQGAVAGSLVLPTVTLNLQPATGQQTALHRLLANQQNPGSPDFHRWLTPEQYADQFGVSPADIASITAWLQSQGLRVQTVARSRTWVRFSGTASQVETAFRTQIHQYLEDGKVHYANATDPSIPAALSGIVRSIGGLNDFRLKPRYRQPKAPAYTALNGDNQMVPDDFATIYDITPLYSAGIDGTGESMVVVGQTAINLVDIETFRTKYGLPSNNPQLMLVPGSTNPGISQSDLPEADLDLEWSGAVARNAHIIYVYSDDVDTSVMTAIDEAYAPVISMSYGLCENFDLVDMPTFQGWALQANAEGITWLAAAGDAGAADCDDGDLLAENGFTVDQPGSIPEVTSMGGTQFNEGSGTYWKSSNSATGESAISYIPEVAWNESELGFGLEGTGGGTSVFFAQPIWQTTAPGVPNNGYRNVPDLSIAASPDHDGYYVETGNKLQIYGGTSLAAPTMAGIVTLLNQYLVSTGALAKPGLANINPELYWLAQNGAAVFHDVTSGDNDVPCVPGSPNCSNGLLGYSAAANYDRATGLGSPDANALVHAWSTTAGAPTAASVVLSSNANPVFEQNGQWPFTITMSEEAGIAATLTSFSINGAAQNITAVFGTASIPANGSISSSSNLTLSNLSVPSNVNFTYSWTDSGGSHGPVTVTIPFAPPDPAVVISGVSNAASGQQAFAPGMLISIYGSGLGAAVQTAGTIPLPQILQGFSGAVGNFPVPLSYVSPDQVNLQIPYETPLGSTTLSVGNPYVNANYTLNIVAAAPGIFQSNGFVFPPYNTAAQGAETALFITGAGAVSPAVNDGDTPSSSTALANLPKPTQNVTVMVANQTAVINFMGITPGLVGVVQINYTVPTGVPTGVQPVVVTVGTAASPPANLTVTQ